MPKFKIPTEDTFFKKLTIALLILGVVLLTGTVFLHDMQTSYGESFYKTIELITHIKTERSASPAFSITLSLIGYITQFYVLYVLLEYTLEGRLQNLFTEVKTLKNIKNMKGHFLVCGGGRVGQHVADELKKAKKPYVILEADESRYKKLAKKNYTVLNNDALDEHELLKANIKNAAWMIACLGDDGDNILLVLTTKELNPRLNIAARANHSRIVQKLKHAGAMHIVLPEALGGINLAQAAMGVKTTSEESMFGIDYKG